MMKTINRKFNENVSHDNLRLHSSERNTPFGKLFDDYLKSLKEEDIRFYPNTQELNPYIEKFYKYDNFLMGFGSDRCIKYFIESNSKGNWFFGKKKLIITEPSFSMYEIYGQIYNLKIVKVNYNIIKFPIEEFLNSVDRNSIIIFSNPSSPIGDVISRENIKRILDLGRPTLIDEAYIEFSNEESCIELIKDYDNLYVTRTLSKAGGSAGVRFGVIFSQEKNIENMNQYRDMYEISGQTLKWVKLILKNKKIIDTYVNKVKEVRKNLLIELYNRQIYFIPSQSNWFHIKESDLKNLPKNVIFKKNCKIPNRGDDWVRLQITDNIKDYDWILKN